jgi:hypothetical protein
MTSLVDTSKIGDGTVSYEKRKFTGSVKILGRYREAPDKDVTRAVVVEAIDGADNELRAYGTLLINLSAKQSGRDDLAQTIRNLANLDKSFVEIATLLNKSPAYISQTAMLYEITNPHKKSK